MYQWRFDVQGTTLHSFVEVDYSAAGVVRDRAEVWVREVPQKVPVGWRQEKTQVSGAIQEQTCAARTTYPLSLSRISMPLTSMASMKESGMSMSVVAICTWNSDLP